MRKCRRAAGCIYLVPYCGLCLLKYAYPASSATYRYYIDDSGNTQGPYPPNALRGWLLAGYLRSSTRVAPSFYGEVPVDDKFQPVSVLWSDATQAFATAEGAEGAPRPAELLMPHASHTGTNAEEDGDASGEDESYTLGPMAKSKHTSRPSPYGDGGRGGRGRGGAGAGKGRGNSGRGGGGRGGGGKGGGGKGSSGKGAGRIPPHLLRYQAFASVGHTGFMGGGAMGHFEGGKPKPNSAGPK
eukprot:scaffold1242_cov123-Isochrysis_galbana.AAC.5